MTKAMFAKLAALLVVTALTVGVAASYGGFSDVQSDKYYADPIAWLTSEGLTTGYAPGCFGPDRELSRGDAVVLLWRLAGRPNSTGASPFTDVVNEYQRDAINWAYETGVTTGTGALTFSPHWLVTRGDYLTLLARFAGEADSSTTSPFVDISNPWQLAPIAWAWSNGITSGTSEITFDPNRLVTRGEAATFMWRYKDEPRVSTVSFDDYCRDGAIASLDCVPSSPDAVGWKGIGLATSDLVDKRSGTINITKDGTILENFDISGNIVVEADDVIIRRGRIRFGNSNSFAVIQNRGSNLVIEDVEIDGSSNAENAVWEDDYTARRLDVHSITSDAFKAHGNVLIEQVVAHDRYAFSPSAHADAIQVQHGSNIIIRCSLLDWGLPDGYGANDQGVSVSGGQGIWLAYDGQGARIDNVIIDSVIITAAGYVLGWQTETYGAICNVVAISDAGWGVLHPSNLNPKGTLDFELVIDGATDTVVGAPGGVTISNC